MQHDWDLIGWSLKPSLHQRKNCWAYTSYGVQGAIALFITLLTIVPIHAQNLPDLDPEQPQRFKLPKPLPEPDLTTPTLEPNLDFPELLNQCQTEIFVEGIEIIADHPVLSEASLQAIRAQYSGRSLSCAQLIRLGFAVAEAYEAAGYSITDAITEIPPATQTADRGIVHVVITETRLSEIQVLGLKRLQTGYVRSRIPDGIPLNIPELQMALQLLSLDPNIESLEAELRTDVQPGSSILTLNIKEAKTLTPQIMFDNNRASSVGSQAQRLGFETHNASGNGDRLVVGYTRSVGSNGLDVSYTLPIHSRNGTLNLSHQRQQSRIIESPFDALDIESASTTTELTIRQPFIHTIRDDRFEELALGLTLSRREGQTSLLNIPFPLSLGAESDGTTQKTVLRFFQDYTQQSATEVLALRSQFNLGVDWFDVTINEQIVGAEFIPDSRFFSWQGQVQWIRVLAPNTLWLVRGNVQLADQGLLPSEQFTTGGAAGVRGYGQDLLTSDNGLEFSTEVWLPILRLGDRSVVQLTPFFDYGLGWNSSGRTEPEPNQLAAVGLGLRWVKDTLTLRLNWGLPLIPVEGDRDNWQENGFYFSLEWLGF